MSQNTSTEKIRLYPDDMVGIFPFLDNYTRSPPLWYTDIRMIFKSYFLEWQPNFHTHPIHMKLHGWWLNPLISLYDSWLCPSILWSSYPMNLCLPHEIPMVFPWPRFGPASPRLASVRQGRPEFLRRLRVGLGGGHCRRSMAQLVLVFSRKQMVKRPRYWDNIPVIVPSVMVFNGFWMLFNVCSEIWCFLVWLYVLICLLGCFFIKFSTPTLLMVGSCSLAFLTLIEPKPVSRF